MSLSLLTVSDVFFLSSICIACFTVSSNCDTLISNLLWDVLHYVMLGPIWSPENKWCKSTSLAMIPASGSIYLNIHILQRIPILTQRKVSLYLKLICFIHMNNKSLLQELNFKIWKTVSTDFSVSFLFGLALMHFYVILHIFFIYLLLYFISQDSD